MGDYWDYYLVLEMEQRMVLYLVMMMAFLTGMVLYLVVMMVYLMVKHWDYVMAQSLVF